MKSIAFWSAGSAVGKSTLALAMTFELARRGSRVALFDLDVENPAGRYLLGDRDHPAGIAAMTRLVGQGRFNEAEFFRLSTEISVGPIKFRFVPGLSASRRWAEANFEVVENILDLLPDHFDFVVFDLGSKLVEPDSEEATACSSLAWQLLDLADQRVAVTGSEPNQIARFLEHWPEFSSVGNGSSKVVVNRFKTTILGLKGKQQITETLGRLAHTKVAQFIAECPVEVDRALASGLPCNSSRRGKLKQAINDLASDLQAEHTQVGLAMAKLN